MYLMVLLKDTYKIREIQISAYFLASQEPKKS